ncbi:MAG TPA: cupin domain-containing protein [Burkholderiales bacterium]|nr:cupin domain-containing protein [Burkholderiales bacterium]
MTGVWECQAGTMKLIDYPFDEYCQIISGKVVITNEEGHEEIFVAGDAFTIEKGFKGTWHMPVTVRKFYAIYQAQ